MLQKSQSLTAKQWEQEYQGENPHWANDMNPSKFAQEFVQFLQEHKVEKILEIGCGNGRDSIFFANSGFNVVAIDVAPSAIELAEGNIKKAHVFVDTRVGNANDLSFPSNDFDAVFSLSVLHSSNLQKSLPEIYRVLGRDKYAFTYIYGNTQFADQTIKEIISVDNYVNLLKSVGFKILDFYTEEEEDFDEYGEKHKLLICTLQKGDRRDKDGFMHLA